MRYYLDRHTLFIRGAFRVASTEISGGIRNVSTILNHTVPDDFLSDNPAKELELVAARAGLGRDLIGLLTSVSVENLCVLQYDFVTVFITAGIPAEPEPKGNAGTINIIVHSSEGMSDAALVETIMIAAEAKAESLLGAGYKITGTATDAIIAACKGGVQHQYALQITDVGKRVREAVRKGVPEAIRLGERNAGAGEFEPAFFIYSRLKKGHWVSWSARGCTYYPCHFPGQSCEFCYCPFYPCHKESLGQWAPGSNGSRVWNCAGCTPLHEPDIADYLKQFPEASLEELEQLKSRKKK